MPEEIAARAIVFAALVGAGILMLWLARATAEGRLGRNQFAGIRVPVTMASDQAWVAAHRAAKRPTQMAGWCAVCGGVVALLLPFEAVMVLTLAAAALMVGFALWGAVIGARAARERDRHDVP